ncbi:MAG: PIG-L family deacetylase [Saprospiraceae bacterium]|nr:PIG-L family deacetylase [Saprospiraceae bacterium]
MLYRLIPFIVLLCFTSSLPVWGQDGDAYIQRPPDAASIYQKMEKLEVLGTVMYMAAHPDDENTRLISWFSRQRKAHTVYLSLTRGDGGQNLIGTEFSELLGVLRTQELLAARRTDGGEQWFTRANDFGYSKNAEETLSIWNKEEVLADVVYAIRKFRPEIIVNRFDANSSGETHGHHTASAMLSLEACRLAGDPSAYPEQLSSVQPWQPRRVFFNTSWWFYGSREAFDAADKSRMVQVDIGVYEPWSGFSNSEIASKSRSQHRCQGFGSALSRGSSIEYLDLLVGDLPTDDHDPLAGIDMSWHRTPDGGAIQAMVKDLLSMYDFRQPSSSVPALLQLYKAVSAQKDHPWKEQKLKEISRLIADCTGLFAEWTTEQATGVAGGNVQTHLDIIQRVGPSLQLAHVVSPALGLDSTIQRPLVLNEAFTIDLAGQWSNDVTWTAPYWLLEPQNGGLYTVPDPSLRGRPESPSDAYVRIELTYKGTLIPMKLPLAWKRVDPAYGERYQPYAILPKGFVTPDQPVALFPTSNSKDVHLKIKAGLPDFRATLFVDLPEGWRAEPDHLDVHIPLQGGELPITIQVFPPEKAGIGIAQFRMEGYGHSMNKALREVQYEHIPDQHVLMPAEMKLVHVDLQVQGREIGYITGAGDQVPECLREAGYRVTLLADPDLNTSNLERYDAVIVGIRAYNTRESLKYHQQALQEYTSGGGTVIVQYNTSRGLVCDPSPLPLQLSRNRVTVESATISILQPEHPGLTFPNKIDAKDFDGWVQERGLYFPDQWDDAFTPLLAAADPGEDPSKGMLLVAPYGKGTFVYTGLSFFRQLPAGVPGAYRLLANLIALGQTNKP